jgi:hypothetical protein
MLATMTRMGLPYVVHEYLQPHWHPRYFVDVAREMAESSLHFVGQLPLHLNYRDLALPPALLDLFKGKGMESRIAFESLKDFALNEFFRRDVYVKGERPCSAATTRAYLESTAFGTLVGEGQIEREARLPHRTLRYEGPLFDALIPALCAGATTVSELALRPELAAAGRDRIRESLMLLVLGGQVIPMARPAVPAPAPAAALYHLPLAYNRMMLGQRLSADNPILLASPAAGTAIVLPQLEAISLRLLTEVPPEQRSAWIRALVARQPLRLRVGDRWIEDADEKARVIADQLEHFRARRLPKLLDLEIVAPGPGAKGA